MVITNFAKSGLALLMAGSADKPRFLAIGSGSGAELIQLGSLIAEVFGARRDFTTREIDIPNRVTWLYDFSSVTMSGLTLTEFGIGAGSTVGVQDLWNREGFTGIEFDGSNELQVEIQFEIF